MAINDYPASKSSLAKRCSFKARLRRLRSVLSARWRRQPLWKRIAIPILSLIALAAVWIVVAFLKISPLEISLAAWRSTFVDQAPCHEACQTRRDELAGRVRSGLEKGGARNEKVFLAYLSASGAYPSYSRALWRLAAAVYGRDKLPGYLRTFLLEDASPAVAKEGAYAFALPPSDRERLSERLRAGLEAGGAGEGAEEDDKDRLAAIGASGDGAYLSWYLEIVSGSGPVGLKREAVKDISNIKEKSQYFTGDQLEDIRILALAPETDPALRRDLVLLLGDYYLVFPEAATAAWRAVAADTSLDNISRAFATDSLNHLLKEDNPLPDVSEEEWAAYYSS